MSGEPSFFEIGVPDGRRAQSFYAALFGWTMHPMEGDQAWIETPSIAGGLHDEDEDRRIEVYFAVEDIDLAVETVRKLGGQAEDPGPETPGFGRFSACRDDQGVRFGLRQPPAGGELLDPGA